MRIRKPSTVLVSTIKQNVHKYIIYGDSKFKSVDLHSGQTNKQYVYNKIYSSWIYIICNIILRFEECFILVFLQPAMAEYII